MATLKREMILDTAREMFNRQGYDRVTMRALSDKLGISVGNLTYYYPKKEMLLQALMQKNMQKTVTGKQAETLRDLEETLKRMLDSMEENLFYFIDPNLYCRDGVMILSDENKVWQQLYADVEALQKKGLFRADFDTKTQHAVLDVLLLSHVSWLRQKVGHYPNAMTPDDFLNAHWCILRPFLTEQGMEEYDRTIKK